MIQATRTKRWERLAALLRGSVPGAAPAGLSGNKGEVARVHHIASDDRTVAILDDKLELTAASRIAGQDASGEHAMAMADLGPGMLIEAEGQWLDRHRFFAEKVTVNLRDSEKQVHALRIFRRSPAKPVKFPVEIRRHLRRTVTGWTSAHRRTGVGRREDRDAEQQQQASSDPGIGSSRAIK